MPTMLWGVGMYIFVKVSFNLCPLLDVILTVVERIFQADEIVGMSWGRDKNVSRRCSQATEGGRQCIWKESEGERAGPYRLAKGVCVLSEM